MVKNEVFGPPSPPTVTSKAPPLSRHTRRAHATTSAVSIESISASFFAIRLNRDTSESSIQVDIAKSTEPMTSATLFRIPSAAFPPSGRTTDHPVPIASPRSTTRRGFSASPHPEAKNANTAIAALIRPKALDTFDAISAVDDFGAGISSYFGLLGWAETGQLQFCTEFHASREIASPTRAPDSILVHSPTACACKAGK